ncbi:MAG: aminoacyl-histidine dipeptidase [Robiginitalea sp.]|uniref:aminoacyl-histidine dipeptidase n=1 Tax=Robiginitalea sp. TaxID=1902411 RepID=UPI003C74A3E1
MSDVIANIEPITVWKHFSDLNAVPRPSKKEERVIAFMMDFGASLGLETLKDPVGNILIRKPASHGMENRKTVVLQAHLDMVHQKNNATAFDFEVQGIQMFLDGDWVRAKGTTLGADNGLGVAAIMGILASDEIAHPPLEALFTIDEETGMTGAKGLADDVLTGSILLNLDTEEDDTLCVGCAGGVDVTARGTYTPVAADGEAQGLHIRINGLQGGHSGMDIHKGLGNANLLLGRMLLACRKVAPVSLAAMDGGGLRNAIPREAHALLAIPSDKWDMALRALEIEKSAVLEEYREKEPDLRITAEPAARPEKTMDTRTTTSFLNCLYSLYNGVYAMSSEFPTLVESSNNVARVQVGEGRIEIGSLTRSSRESAKADLVRKLKASFEPAGYQVTTGGDYPGWLPDTSSPILAVVTKRYTELFGESPQILAGHGGLECGILKNHYPEIDMVSFGPTILGAHSPDERASISSTRKFWALLQDVLKHIPHEE